MAKINLLPWREERRENLKREFFTLLIAAGFAGMLLAAVVYKVFDAQLEDQLAANQLIEFQKTAIEAELKDVGEFDKTRAQLETRIGAVHDLQAGRAAVVHYFDDLVKAMPAEDIYLTEVSRVGGQYTIKGKGSSPNVVSEFLRNLDVSQWYQNAFMTGFTQANNLADSTTGAAAGAAVASVTGAAASGSSATQAEFKPISALPLPEETYGLFDVTVSVEEPKGKQPQGAAASPGQAPVVLGATTPAPAVAVAQ